MATADIDITLSRHAAAHEPDAHTPVMLDEVLQTIAPADGETYVDGTFGAGGYSRALLAAANCKVIAIDRDPSAVAAGRALEALYPDRFCMVAGCFGDVAALLQERQVGAVNGFVLDLGVSSMQLDQAERGFSFRQDGPLDMRMDQDRGALTAADVVNTYDEHEIADILYRYGEEKASRRIARKIVAARAEKPIETTAELAALVHAVLPMHGGIKSDTATRSFQALRIFVNNETGELDQALEAAKTILLPGGRLVVVTFHSLEDRQVKTFLRDNSGSAPTVSRHLPVGPAVGPVFFEVPQKSGLAPGDAEVARNPRARSARLRYGIRGGDHV